MTRNEYDELSCTMPLKELSDYSKLTEKDRRLVAWAQRMSEIQWGDIYDLAEQADTVQGFHIIFHIGIYKRHLDEAEANML